MPDFTSSARRPRLPLRQRGQALVFGIAVLLGAAAATFYVFNTGQLTAEKTKLVNTADAVAYSAGVMHARALNFDAYTNRALIANEATVAQMVSISSWLEYANGHMQGVPPLNCYTPYYAVPNWTGAFAYYPLCFALSTVVGAYAVQYADTYFNSGSPPIGAMAVMGAELAKTELKLMQATMFASFVVDRNKLLQEVANANYLNEGTVSVDTLPLTDEWSSFQGRPFISLHQNDDRARMREAIVAAVDKDDFVRDRSWTVQSPWPCLMGPGRAERRGGTRLNGYDSWEASDRAHFEVEGIVWHWDGPNCEQTAYYDLGNGQRTANASSTGGWQYTGVPDFFELSDAALNYRPPGSSRPDPRLQFAIRVTRPIDQTRTSAGTSAVKPTGRLRLFDGAAADNVLAAVATSEVYFDREREDDHLTELGSLFNPYWQVHLVGNSAAVVAAAKVLQGAPSP
jgi:hypothetical protein